jgi:hypothetical protein
MNFPGGLQSIVNFWRKTIQYKKRSLGKPITWKFAYLFSHDILQHTTSIIIFCFFFHIQHRRWTLHVPLKHPLTFNRLYTVISQKTELFIATAVRTSNSTVACTFGNMTALCILNMLEHLSIYTVQWKHQFLRSMDWSRWSTILATQISRPRPPPRLLTVQARERS